MSSVNEVAHAATEGAIGTGDIAEKIANEYSGADYTDCPDVGNRNSALKETTVPVVETIQ
jgi:hypothetical protein